MRGVVLRWWFGELTAGDAGDVAPLDAGAGPTEMVVSTDRRRACARSAG
jgi:hypothetical protein